MNDHDVIATLQRTGLTGPALHNSPADTLAVGRKSVARRRAAFLGAATLGLAALSIGTVNLLPAGDTVVVSTPAGGADGGPGGSNAADTPAPVDPAEPKP